MLLVAALRTLAARLASPPADLMDPVTGPDTYLPDLDRDGWIPLSWIPGLGTGRARAVVDARPHLGVPLTPARLRWVPGIGAETAREAEAWYARGGREPPAAPG